MSEEKRATLEELLDEGLRYFRNKTWNGRTSTRGDYVPWVAYAVEYRGYCLFPLYEEDIWQGSFLTPEHYERVLRAEVPGEVVRAAERRLAEHPLRKSP